MTLFDAVASADLAVLRAALAQGGDLDVLGEGRTTPLIAAASAGWLEGVKLLLAAGAEPGWKDAASETAFLKAAANGHASVAAVLGAYADDDERDLGRAFLAAFGASHGPDFHDQPGQLRQKAVEVAARAADFVGHEDPLRRVERQQRSTRKK
jgi:ankyrin repeat protein